MFACPGTSLLIGEKGSTIRIFRKAHGAKREGHAQEVRPMTKKFRQLGSGETKYEYQVNPELLETFDNPHPDRDYKVTFTTSELTSLCPITGQPDFYRITITYIPDRRCLESKSLKLYLFSYRQSGMFAEDMANSILDDLVEICRPRWMELASEMNPRGGIGLTVRVEHKADEI
jgi:7-cyano-7-deazaguanine reductase